MRKPAVPIVEAPATVSCAARAAPADVEADVEAVLPLIKLMSEPNRLRIFALLAGGELCVCEIEAAMRLPQNLISHHLGVLREAGLIRARRDGRWVHYAIDKAALARVYPAVCRLFNPECVGDDPVHAATVKDASRACAVNMAGEK
jgi:DNA-binding transcriptional ArsR family regulator